MVACISILPCSMLITVHHFSIFYLFSTKEMTTILCPTSFNSWLLFTCRVHLFEVFMRWRPLFASILDQYRIIKFITGGSEVEENKRKYVALRINDGQFICFVIFPVASKSRCLFRESPGFLSSCTVVAKAQKNTFISIRSQRKACLVNGAFHYY